MLFAGLVVDKRTFLMNFNDFLNRDFSPFPDVAGGGFQEIKGLTSIPVRGNGHKIKSLSLDGKFQTGQTSFGIVKSVTDYLFQILLAQSIQRVNLNTRQEG